MIALVDCHSFYSSCHQVFRPDLRDAPVVVLSNNDGFIVARSKEAKLLGIPDLTPFFKIEKFLKKNHVHIFSSNYALYGDISQRVMTELQAFSNDVEVYSIDEMFLDLKNVLDDLTIFGQQVHHRIWQNVRLRVGVGIGPTKTLSKLASRASKKIPRCHSVAVFDEQKKWQWMQARTAVSDVWGVGRRISKKLNKMGIYSALDLAQANPKMLRKHFNVCLERTIEELNGIPCIDLEDAHENRQQIYCTRSFGDKLTTLQPIKQATALYSRRATQKLRKQDCLARTLHVFLHTSPFEENYYSRSAIVKLPYDTDDIRVITKKALEGISSIFKPGKRYMKAGVGIIELVDKKHIQKDLFHQESKQRCSDLMKTIDEINQKYSTGIFLAREGFEKKWYMRQQYTSPCYTTRWKDIPSVIC